REVTRRRVAAGCPLRLNCTGKHQQHRKQNHMSRTEAPIAHKSSDRSGFRREKRERMRSFVSAGTFFRACLSSSRRREMSVGAFAALLEIRPDMLDVFAAKHLIGRGVPEKSGRGEAAAGQAKPGVALLHLSAQCLDFPRT